MFDRPTRLFLRWRDRGDAAALAELFDRTAPELLRLAVHLCRHAVDAEDVLQATFLAAIESAQRFERGQRVMPWLTGILTHRALAEHRRRQRLPVAAADGERAGGGAEPFQHAQSSELHASTRAAIDRLREPYRQPTMLRLVHGMEPAEIALLLQRSPGTVRAQLHRGLEQLRRLLPAGIATSLAVGAFAGRGMAAVKQAVLAASHTHVVAASVVTTSGFIAGMLMGKKIVVGAGVLLAWLGWFAWAAAWPDETDAEPVALVTASTPEVTQSEVATAAPTSTVTLPAPERTDSTPSHAGTPWPLRGQVVDGATGAPIAGAIVSLTGPRRLTLLDVQRELGAAAPPQADGVPVGCGAPWRTLRPPPAVLSGDVPHDFLLPPTASMPRLATTTTDAAGRFDLAVPPTGGMVRVEQAGYGVRYESIAEAPQHPVRIELCKLRTVRGHVRTDDGTPLPHPVQLVLRAIEGVWFATTDPTGRFTVDVAAPQLSTESHTHGLVVVGGELLRSFDGEEELVLTRFGGPRLHVVDAATQRPIEIVRLVSWDTAGYPQRAAALFAPNGYVWLHSPEGLSAGLHPRPNERRDPLVPRLVVWSDGYGSEELRDLPMPGKDPATIEVRLHRGAVAALRGTISRAGTPLSGVTTLLRPAARLQWGDHEWKTIAAATTDEHGRFELTAPAGDHLFEARDASGLRIQQQVTVPSAALVLDIEDGAFLEVQLTDAAGSPAVGHLVAAQGATGQQHSAKTDAVGNARIGPYQPGPVTMFAERVAGRWEDRLTEDLTLGRGERRTVPLRITPPPRLRVRIAFDGDAPPEGLAGFRATWYGQYEPSPVAPDGTVEAQAPPDTEVAILGPGSRTWTRTIPADAVGEHTLRLQWRGLAYFGTLQDLDGNALPGVSVRAYPIGLSGGTQVVTQRDGSFRLDGLLPVRHRISFGDQPPHEGKSFLTAEPPTASGVELALRIPLGNEPSQGSRLLTGTVADANGPIAGVQYIIESLYPQSAGVLAVLAAEGVQRTGHDGALRGNVAAAPRHRLRVWPGAGKPALEEEFTLPAGTDAVVRDFVLR
ncbi:MAG: sigma-70 family RNA polymerase sigma factor [Planctomycetes bacterium]|jgi:RNA polymerase sigma-70 factor (ECF subfamily)|nr:sigma-70 family RNA polymerase sigma factor [Planctomycetota bacterium]